MPADTTSAHSPTPADAPAFAKNRGKTWALLLLWGASVMLGINALAAHSARPGAAASAPTRWPAGTSVVLDPARPTLLMLAHPRCPCTRASLGELAIAMDKLHGRVAAHVLFAEPKGANDDWEHTSQWAAAARIPGVVVHGDPSGHEAARFGSRTSGQVVLYAPTGKLLFAGGITGARGHMGDNVGLARIMSLVSSGAADGASSSVFGCPLFDEEP